MATTTATKKEIANPAFRLKGNLFTLTVLHLLRTDVDLTQHLKKTIEQAPKFFENAPIVIDLNELDSSILSLDLVAITQALKHQGLIPVGVRGGDDKAQQQARMAGLAILANSTPSQSVETKPKTKIHNKKESKKTAHTPTKVITQPVRSGQQIYAKGGDLIVLSSVGHGAEILADGHIHVYGPLRGRALAGILGNTEASIFCQSLDAEMLSIAGRYLVNEQLGEQKDRGALHIYLKEEQLMFDDL